MDAPRVFISYSHDSREHKDRILSLSDRLRSDGVDCIIDQCEESPEEGWPIWCQQQVERAKFVLIACTETYLRRFGSEEESGKGSGAIWEGRIITQELYNSQGKNRKFIPFAFSREDAAFVPLLLQSATIYVLDSGYESLRQRLTGQSLPKLQRKLDVATLWHVPHRKNILFTGREDVLADIQKALGRRGSAALSGLGGVGKTQTAIEYASRNRQSYQAIFWTGASSREALLAGFAYISGALNLPSAQAKDQELVAAEVKRWLEDNTGWLLILDNADELHLVQPFLPQEGKGHLLFTTRAHAVATLAERVVVRDMEPEEGALLLLRRAGLVARASETDRRDAMALSDSLGGLPLAIDQAGAFIEEMRLGVSEYAELYAAERAVLLAKRGAIGDHQPVTVTFSLAFDKVAEKSAAAADLLRLCAFLAPDPIPEEIFVEGDAPASKLSVVEMIGEAGRFSLLDRDPVKHLLSVHRLVQIVIREGMSRAEQRIWAERAVRTIGEAFPLIEFSNWGYCQKLIGHAQACAGLIEEWDLGFGEAAKLLNQAAYYLDDRALYAEAEPLYQRSLAIWEKALGPDHPDVALSLNNLAVLYRNQGKYAEAEPLYQRSLAIWEKALGPDHPDVALSLNNLAVLYRNQGKYAEAEPLYQRSLAIWEKALGLDHPDVAVSLNNLADLYRQQERYAEAEPLYQRSLAIWEKALGLDHPDVALSLNNLAGLYRDQGRYAEAEPLYQRSLAIWEKALGPNHPDVATSLNDLAMLYEGQGKYGEAEPLYERSLAIREKALGPDHSDTVLVRSNLHALRNMMPPHAE